MWTSANRYKARVALSLLLVFILDMFTPLGVAVGVLYVVAFYFATKASARAITVYAVVSIVLVLFKMLFFISGETGWMVYTNRGLSAIAIVAVALFAIRRRKLADQIEWERETYIRILRDKNEKLNTYRRSLNLHLLVSVIDKDGLITFVNQPFGRISQYAQEELIGHSFFNMWDLSNEAKLEMHKNINQGETWRGEIKGHARDGSIYWCDTVIFPVRDESGSIREFFSISMPITERKEFERQQQDHLKTFETILWKVSHKLRAPIATCQGITHLLDKKHATGSGMDEIEAAAMRNRRHCTHELEEFSREIIDMIEVQQKLR